MRSKIIRNQAKCLKCEVVVESKFTHDYKVCKCGNLSVDGGKEYLKRNFEDISMIEEQNIFLIKN